MYVCMFVMRIIVPVQIGGCHVFPIIAQQFNVMPSLMRVEGFNISMFVLLRLAFLGALSM